jgi:hypothetical protein
MDHNTIPWMSPEETNRFLKELKASLRRGRSVKPTTYQEFLEAEMYRRKDIPDTTRLLVV